MSEATKKASAARWLSAEERFLSRANVRDLDQCWEWSGSTKNGYGVFNIEGRGEYVHRWSYEHYIGPIPAGLVIDHLCRNRVCCNPAHLEAVTNAENVARGEVAARTHCNHGHEFTPENTRHHFYKNRQRAYRSCRECDLIGKRLRSEERRKTAADLLTELSSTRDRDQRERLARGLRGGKP